MTLPKRHHRRPPFVPISLLLSGSCFLTLSSCHEIPKKKAMPPLMDPIPILPEITNRIFMDVAILKGDDNNNSNNVVDSGRIIIGLFGYNAPTAAENFRILATCPNQMKLHSQQKQIQRVLEQTQEHIRSTINQDYNVLCYKGTIFHRIIPNFIIQGGDTTHYNGIGGISAISPSNGTYVPYMMNQTKFNRPYMVATTASRSNDKNNNHHPYVSRSQFFITTAKTQWLDSGAPNTKYIIFGMILEGVDYLHSIERQTGTYGGHPSSIVQIQNIGELPLEAHDKEPHY